MRMLKYEVIIYWSKEYAASIAEIPEFPGGAKVAHGVVQLVMIVVL